MALKRMILCGQGLDRSCSSQEVSTSLILELSLADPHDRSLEMLILILQIVSLCVHVESTRTSQFALDPEPAGGYGSLYAGSADSEIACKKLHARWLDSPDARDYLPRNTDFQGLPPMESYGAFTKDWVTATFFCRDVRHFTVDGRRVLSLKDGPWDLNCDRDKSERAGIAIGTSRYMGRTRRYAICMVTSTKWVQKAALKSGTTQCIDLDVRPTKDAGTNLRLAGSGLAEEEYAQAWISAGEGSIGDSISSTATITWSSIVSSGTITNELEHGANSLALEITNPEFRYRACAKIAPGAVNAQLNIAFL